jgi:uncharacterized RDD family membrane protein YckC
VNAFAQPSAAPVVGPQLDNRRVLAAFVDLLVIFAGGFVLGLVVGLVNGADAEWGGGMQAISLAWALYYYFAFESGDGQTLGKKLLKLRVIRADGGPAGMREIAIRTILRVIDGLFLYLVGLIVMLVTGERRQRLGDIAAGTVVADASTVPAPQVNAATAAPPAAATPEGLDEPERPDDFEPSERTPADVGRPLEGITPPQPIETPHLTHFEPFSEPAADADETEVQDEHRDEPQALDEADSDVDIMRSESHTEWPHMYATRAHEAETELSPQPEEPHLGDVPDPAAREPEPMAHAPEPTAEHAEPTAEQAEPAADAPAYAEGLEADAARTGAEPLGDTSSEVPGLAGSPVEEPQDVAPAAADDQPAVEDAPAGEASFEAEEPSDRAEEPSDRAEEPSDRAEEASDETGDVTVKPIETVSAIDLVMGGNEQEQPLPAPADRTDPAPEVGEPDRGPHPADEPDSDGERPAGL